MLITLVRHGESTGNIMQRWQGITDGPLTDEGLMQAELVARELSKYKFAAIFSSPLSRALDTAKAIQAALLEQPSLSPEIITDPRFIELNMGALEEASWSVPYQIQTRDTPFPGGGESLNDVLARALSSLELLLSSFTAGEVADHHVLLVSHGMFLTELIHALCISYSSAWVDVAWSNTGITTIELDHQGIRFVRINDTNHLLD